MEIKKLLEGSKAELKANIQLLAADYKKITGRKVCLSCPSDINYMILVLKNHYNMSQFRFKNQTAQYKNKKGDKVTVKNDTLTDEIAIEFLKTNPERIKLFSNYPKNWETLLINGVVNESEAEKEARLAIEAEMQAIKEGEKPTRETMQTMTLKELRTKYPSIKANSVDSFIEKVLK